MEPFDNLAVRSNKLLNDGIVGHVLALALYVDIAIPFHKLCATLFCFKFPNRIGVGGNVRTLQASVVSPLLEVHPKVKGDVRCQIQLFAFNVAMSNINGVIRHNFLVAKFTKESRLFDDYGGQELCLVGDSLLKLETDSGLSDLNVLFPSVPHGLILHTWGLMSH